MQNTLNPDNVLARPEENDIPTMGAAAQAIPNTGRAT